jgi:hypothetical protein
MLLMRLNAEAAEPSNQLVEGGLRRIPRDFTGAEKVILR